MTAVAWGVVVAIAALLIGGVSVPVYLHRRNAQQTRRANLIPAYDEVVRAVNRLRSVGFAIQTGFDATPDEQWESDVTLVKETGGGRFPVTNPSERLREACEVTATNAFLLSHNLREHSRFNEQSFDREFVWAKDQGQSAGLFRLLSNEIDGVIRRQFVASALVQSCDTLVQLLHAKRDYDIRDSG